MLHPEQMRQNLDSTRGLYNSQRVLLALTQAGMSREEAYAVVQRAAMAVWNEGADFRKRLEADPAVGTALGAGGVAACFDMEHHLKHVDTIFARVFRDGLTRFAAWDPCANIAVRATILATFDMGDPP